jgi:hypothetical protein
MPKTIIYLAAIPGGFVETDFIGCALSEHGDGICQHLSSSIEWAKHDMGLTSNWKHDIYDKWFPDGYELVWIDNPETDPRWQEVIELNKLIEKKRDCE